MARATLTFNLPEEEEEYKRANTGYNAFRVLEEYDNKLREWIKYGNKFSTPTEALEAAREHLGQIMHDWEIHL